MNFSYGPYSADVDPMPVAGTRQVEYHVAVSRCGTVLYEHFEQELDEAIRVALAYLNWELEHHADA